MSALRYNIQINISPKKQPLATVGGRGGPDEGKATVNYAQTKKIILQYGCSMY